MGLFSFLKRKRRTLNANYTNYRRFSDGYKKAIVKPKRSFFEEKKPKNERLLRKASGIKEKLFLFVKVVFGTLILGGLFNFLLLSGTFEIQKIEVESSFEESEDQYLVNSYLQNYLGENILLFASNKHEAALRSQIPYLKDLKIKRKLPHTLLAVMESYPKVANVKVVSPSAENIYIINELGFISAIGSFDEALPTIIMDVTGTEMDLSTKEEETKSGSGEVVDTLIVHEELVAKDALEKILKTEKNFEGKFNLQIKELNYLKRAKEIHLFTELDFYVWIDMTEDIDLQLAKLKKGLTKLNIYEGNIEYIDLRISGQNGEKIIYKLKNG